MILLFFHITPGLTLKGDEDGCGCVVKSVLKGGAVGLDGRIGVGDHIVAVNDESMIGLSGHRARYRLDITPSLSKLGYWEKNVQELQSKLP